MKELLLPVLGLFAASMHADAGPVETPLATHTANDFVLSGPATTAAVATDLEPSPDPSVVDLGFFYAQELAARGRSLASLDETAQVMVDFMNAALERNGLTLTMRVSYVAVFDESLEGIDTRTAHSRLGQRASELRDTVLTDFGVDAVVLIKATDDADELFGIATLGTENSLSDSNTVPYAVVCLGAAQTGGLECFGRGGIFAHEVGHLFGAGHQRNAPVGGTGGAFEFSYASECGGGTIVYSPVSAAQQIYSTPDISADGEPCGVDASAGADGIDNAHTIDLTRALMADLRPTMPVLGTAFLDTDPELSVTEGDPPVTLDVRRTGDLNESARVSLAVISVNGSSDVSFNPAEVEFGPGEELRSVDITIVDDAAVEATEILEISIRNPLRLENVSETLLLTILDNDVAPPPAPPPPARGNGGGGATDWFLPPILVLLAMASGRKWRPMAVSSRLPGDPRSASVSPGPYMRYEKQANSWS